MAASSYGNYFWGVRTPTHTTMIHADIVEIAPDGSLAFYYLREDKKLLSFAYASGQWVDAWAASMFDGSPVAIDSSISHKKESRR